MNILGALERHETFKSKFITARNVDVWCPPGYFENIEECYPVIYMHDGQNLFDSAMAFGGSGWEIDKTISQLMDDKKFRGAMVVGIWNTDIRWREYMPQKPYQSLALERHHENFINTSGGEPISDAYLRFLVEELKPFIDSNYQALSDQPNTFVMGSSMGGLVSLYAISEYPDILAAPAVFRRIGQQVNLNWCVKWRKTCQTQKHISCILITARKDWTRCMDRIKSKWMNISGTLAMWKTRIG